MAISHEAGSPSLPGGPHAGVICAACGAKFESDGIATGARVRCPLCREVVEVAELVATKRRYRSRRSRALDETRRISATRYRRLLRVFALGLAIAGAAAALIWGWTTNRSNVLNQSDATNVDRARR
jgi:DNA-directed RNA polymerase subunit RPC12/RpoP